MDNITCRYGADRDETLVAYLYDEIDAAGRAAFESHLPTCARCRTELAALSGVRKELGRWQTPEQSPVASLQSPVIGHQSSVDRRQSSVLTPEPLGHLDGVGATTRRDWFDVPVWAQAAAAVLLLGVGAGLANLNVHYDASGLTIRTGWAREAGTNTATRPSADSAAARTAAEPVASPAAAAVVSPDDLRELETRLLAEIHAAQTQKAAVSQAPHSDAELMQRVQALVESSEKRQERELALRVADVMRDVDVQRRTDLTNINRSLGAFQNNTGIEVMRQRELINNLLVRTSQSR